MTDQDMEKLFQPAPVEENDSILFSKHYRCSCGALQVLSKPCFCIKCNTPLAIWKDINGKLHNLSDMDIGHLTATLKMLSDKLEQVSDYRKREYEIALDFFYAELASREKEIAQLASIERGLMKILRGSNV